MHAPFVPPMAEKYGKRYGERLNELKLNPAGRAEADKYRDIYTTILYTDDALRDFFREYAKRPGYSNTIFFITGDHSLPELNTGWVSPMERFRVPFIIWSPMLKQPKEFLSVVSHLDVTPSVLAMLRERYGIKTHPLAHWLGTGFDTSAAFRCDRSLVFLRNNKEMTDFVDGNYCLSAGRLHRIRQDMTAVASREPLTTLGLQKKLDNYIAVTEYVGSANAMIPIWMMFSGNITEHEVPVSDSVVYNGLFKSDGYISVVRKMRIPDEYKYVTVSIRFKMLSKEPDLGKLPRMVFDVTDSTGRSVLWNQYPLSVQGTYKPGQWVPVGFNQSMDLSHIQHPERCDLKLYLWNTSGLTIGCDSLTRKISGFK